MAGGAPECAVAGVAGGRAVLSLSPQRVALWGGACLLPVIFDRRWAAGCLPRPSGSPWKRPRKAQGPGTAHSDPSPPADRKPWSRKSEGRLWLFRRHGPRASSLAHPSRRLPGFRCRPLRLLRTVTPRSPPQQGGEDGAPAPPAAPQQPRLRAFLLLPQLLRGSTRGLWQYGKFCSQRSATRRRRGGYGGRSGGPACAWRGGSAATSRSSSGNA